MIPILKKVLATDKVAVNCCGFFNKDEINWTLEYFSFEASSKSFGVNEKKATSAPETKAEQKSKNTIAKKPNTKSASTIDTKAL